MHGDVELRLVAEEEEREIVPCPEWAREDVRRALAGCLLEIEKDVARCRRRALEAGMGDMARRLGTVAEMVKAVREEA